MFGIPILAKLLDWRFIVAVLLAIIIGLGAWKWRAINNRAIAAEQALTVERKNVETLKGNLEIARQVNESNQQVLKAIEDDRAAGRTASQELTASIAKVNQDLRNAQARIQANMGKPGPVPGYISETVAAIQQSRGAPSEFSATAQVTVKPGATSKPGVTARSIKKVELK